MNERLRSLSDVELGQALASTESNVAWPPSPDLGPAVVAVIADQERQPSLRRPRLSLSSRRRTLLLVAAAVLALAAVAAATKLVIDLGAISIQSIEGRPTSIPSASETSGSTTGAAGLGRAVSLEEAAAIAGFEPFVPAALGTPDGVWVDPGPVSFEEEASRILMAWDPAPGLPRVAGTAWGAVLMQFEGTADVAMKFVYEDTGRIEEAFVDGREAYWTVGVHRLDLLTDDGVITVRVRGNVLLWSDGDLALRLETALEKEVAVLIAESI